MKFTIYSQTSTLHRWSLGTDKWFHPTFHNGCYYLSMPGSKSIRVSKRGPNVVNVLLTSLVLLRPHGVLVRVTPGTPLSVRVMIRAAQITVSYTAHGQQVSALKQAEPGHVSTGVQDLDMWMMSGYDMSFGSEIVGVKSNRSCQIRLIVTRHSAHKMESQSSGVTVSGIRTPTDRKFSQWQTHCIGFDPVTVFGVP